MKKCLIVVDYQNDFVDGSLGFGKAKELDGRIARRIQAYKDGGDDVIFTFDTHRSDYPDTIEGKNLPIVHCLKGTHGHLLYGQVALNFDEEKDVCFEKETFPSLELAEYLKGKEYRSVELCGLVSHICVLSNAVMVKAALPNTPIWIDRELTESYDESLQEAAFQVLRGLHIEIR